MKRIFILSLLSSSLFAADPVEADFYKITTFDTPKETALEVGSIDLMPDGKLVMEMCIRDRPLRVHFSGPCADNARRAEGGTGGRHSA